MTTNWEDLKRELDSRCGNDKAPTDYFCTLQRGHDGPCAAHLKYQGITHGKPVWGWYLWMRRKLYCPRGIHMFDEVQTAGADDGWNHYLSCDACEFMVEVTRVNKEYVNGSSK